LGHFQPRKLIFGIQPNFNETLVDGLHVRYCA
jgi:hypothetical protein